MSSKHSRSTTVRRVVAGAFIFVGLFVTSFGIGFHSVGTTLAGVALLLLSVSGRLVTTLRGTVRQWVAGTGRVVHVSDPAPAAPYGRCELQLVIDAPGLPQETVTLREPRIPVDRWPYPGMEVPVEVAADDIRNVRILWQDYQPPEEAEPEEHEAPEGYLAAPAPAGDPDGIDFDLDGPPTTGGAGPVVPHPRRSPSPRPSPAPAAGGGATATIAGLSTDPGATPAVGDDAAAPAAAPASEPYRAVRGVGATLLVADLATSVAFYRDLLGFSELDRGGGSVVLASAGIRLVLRAAAEPEPVRRRVVHLHLEVGDVASAYAQLKAAGVSFIYPPKVVTRGARVEQWAAMLRDPDGHRIALTQWR